MHHVSGREQAQEGKRPASAHQVGETARDRGTRAFGGQREGAFLGLSALSYCLFCATTLHG